MSRPLTGADEQVFFRLRITEDILRRAKVVRVTGDEAHAEFGINTDGDSGIVFPYFPPPNGSEQHRLTARLRLDHPTFERKYLCPYGDRRHLYFAPCNPEWLKKETPVILVEAEKSALAILRWAEAHDFPLLPIALGGCNSWRGRIGIKTTSEGERVEETGPLPDLDVVNGRRVYVLFDSNVSSNANVKAARSKLTEELLLRKCEVWVIDLVPPPNVTGINGPDDFLGRFGDTEFFLLFHSARRVEQPMGSTAVVGYADMPLEAMYKRLGDICVNHMSEFPLGCSYVALLTAAGVNVLRSELKYIRTNLYGVIAGEPGDGKSQANERALDVVGVKPPQLVKTYGGSAEGMVKKIGDVKGSSVLLWVDELEHLLGLAEEKARSPHKIQRKEFYVECSCGFKGPALNNACRKCGAQISLLPELLRGV